MLPSPRTLSLPYGSKSRLHGTQLRVEFCERSHVRFQRIRARKQPRKESGICLKLRGGSDDDGELKFDRADDRAGGMGSARGADDRGYR
eukprot:3330399-Rhodomonas_salina.1